MCLGLAQSKVAEGSYNNTRMYVFYVIRVWVGREKGMRVD